MKKDKLLMTSIILSLVLTIVLGNSATFDISGGLYKGMPIKITELLMGINLVILLIKKRNNITLIKSFNILFIWIAYGLLMILVNSYNFGYTFKQMAYGALYAFRLAFYMIYVYYVINYFKDLKFKFGKLTDIYVYSYSAVAFIGILQLIFYPKAVDFYALLKNFHIYLLNPDPHENRLISTYLDPNFLGTISSIPIIVCLAKLITHDFSKHLKKGLMYIVFLILLTFMVALTVSRSGIGTLMVSLFIFVLASVRIENRKLYIENFKRFFIAILGMVAIIFTSYYLSHSHVVKRIVEIKTDPSAQARVVSWTQATKVIQKNNPIFGVGYNMYGFVKGATDRVTSFGVDSSIMLILATTGAIGIIIFALYVLSTLKNIFVIRNTKNFYVGNAVMAVFIGSIAGSNFNNLLFYPLWLLPFFVLSNYYILVNKD
ncbi:O-antigen ligase family protein [Clostridium sp. 19966]|uniref:O-antigen ligase family protein n=1 Tax=Clostridium sp. 19966 TaxID=2768166 RepID=UPI0028E04CA7|nr:O-antigen ligase family protein [Clostridium sp. 19966]MDT8716161.1 O-antigen ligase family protein [Clostridium sp. 19966]